MRRERAGGEFASGMVATGFWAGITVGRLVLDFVTPKLGEKFAVLVCLPTLRGWACMTNKILDLHHPRRDMPTHVLARPFLPCIRHLRIAKKLLSRSPISHYRRNGHQSSAFLPPRLSDRVCSSLWWRRRSRASFRHRLPSSSQRGRRPPAHHLCRAISTAASLAMLPETGDEGYRGNSK